MQGSSTSVSATNSQLDMDVDDLMRSLSGRTLAGLSAKAISSSDDSTPVPSPPVGRTRMGPAVVTITSSDESTPVSSPPVGRTKSPEPPADDPETLKRLEIEAQILNELEQSIGSASSSAPQSPVIPARLSAQNSFSLLKSLSAQKLPYVPESGVPSLPEDHLFELDANLTASDEEDAQDENGGSWLDGEGDDAPTDEAVETAKDVEVEAAPAGDASENVAEGVAGDVAEEVTGDAAEDATEDVPGDATEKVAEDVPEDAAEKVAKDVAVDVAEDAPENAAENTAEDVTKDVPENAAENTAEDDPAPAGEAVATDTASSDAKIEAAQAEDVTTEDAPGAADAAEPTVPVDNASPSAPEPAASSASDAAPQPPPTKPSGFRVSALAGGTALARFRKAATKVVRSLRFTSAVGTKAAVQGRVQKKLKEQRNLWANVRGGAGTLAVALKHGKEKDAVKEQTLKRAENAGVVTDEAKFADVPVWVRGDIELYDRENLSKRELIKSHAITKSLIDKWWKLMVRKPNGSYASTIDRVHYIELNMRLYKALVDPFVQAEALDSAEKDWKEDSKGHDVLNYDLFFNSIFELVDNWTDGAEPAEYFSFLDYLWNKITVNGKHWRDTDEIYCSEDEESEEEEEDDEEEEDEGKAVAPPARSKANKARSGAEAKAKADADARANARREAAEEAARERDRAARLKMDEEAAARIEASKKKREDEESERRTKKDGKTSKKLLSAPIIHVIHGVDRSDETGGRTTMLTIQGDRLDGEAKDGKRSSIKLVVNGVDVTDVTVKDSHTVEVLLPSSMLATKDSSPPTLRLITETGSVTVQQPIMFADRPTITAVRRPKGSELRQAVAPGFRPVVLKGSNFFPGSSVHVGGQPVDNVTVLNPTTIVAQIAGHHFALDVVSDLIVEADGAFSLPVRTELAKVLEIVPDAANQSDELARLLGKPTESLAVAPGSTASVSGMTDDSRSVASHSRMAPLRTRNKQVPAPPSVASRGGHDAHEASYKLEEDTPASLGVGIQAAGTSRNVYCQKFWSLGGGFKMNSVPPSNSRADTTARGLHKVTRVRTNYNQRLVMDRARLGKPGDVASSPPAPAHTSAAQTHSPSKASWPERGLKGSTSTGERDRRRRAVQESTTSPLSPPKRRSNVPSLKLRRDTDRYAARDPRRAATDRPAKASDFLPQLPTRETNSARPHRPKREVMGSTVTSLPPIA